MSEDWIRHLLHRELTSKKKNMRDMVCTKQSMHAISLLHHIRMFPGPGTGLEASEWGVRVGQKRDTFWKMSRNVLHMKVWLS